MSAHARVGGAMLTSRGPDGELFAHSHVLDLVDGGKLETGALPGVIFVI